MIFLNSPVFFQHSLIFRGFLDKGIASKLWFRVPKVQIESNGVPRLGHNKKIPRKLSRRFLDFFFAIIRNTYTFNHIIFFFLIIFYLIFSDAQFSSQKSFQSRASQKKNSIKFSRFFFIGWMLLGAREILEQREEKYIKALTK